MHLELDAVRNFMIGFDQPVRQTPVTKLSTEELMLRAHLILEEYKELLDALGIAEDVHGGFYRKDPAEPINSVEALDALTDLLYVVFGTFHSLGLGSVAVRAFAEVHRSNMSKFGEDGRVAKNAAGKVMKGPHYSPPDLKSILASAQPDNPFDAIPPYDQTK